MMLDAEEKSKGIINDAERRADEKVQQLTTEHKARERDLKQVEERLIRKEELLDNRQTNLDNEQESLARKNEDVAKARENAEALIREQQDKLEKVAGLTAEEAKSGLMHAIEKQYENDLEGRMRKLEISGDEKIEKRAKEILTTAVHRLGGTLRWFVQSQHQVIARFQTQLPREGRADQNIAPRGFRDHFERSVKFGSDGHHADVTARGLPEAIKNLWCWLDQVLRRMNAAALMAEKRAFEVNAERLSLQVAIV